MTCVERVYDETGRTQAITSDAWRVDEGRESRKKGRLGSHLRRRGELNETQVRGSSKRRKKQLAVGEEGLEIALLLQQLRRLEPGGGFADSEWDGERGSCLEALIRHRPD